MKRSPIARKTPLKRSGALRSRSTKAAARKPERDAVRAAALKRDGHCVLKHLGGCAGPLDAHEILRRSAKAGTQYDLRFVYTVCRRHHDLDDSNPALAERVGIRIPRWVWDMHEDDALVEAARLRSQTDPHNLDQPFWRK